MAQDSKNRPYTEPERPSPEQDQDEFLDELLSPLPAHWREPVKAHLREIGAGILAIVLGVVLWSAYSSWSYHQEQKASFELASALMKKDPTDVIKALEEVATKTGTSNVKRQAYLLMAAAQRQAGHLDKAIESYKRAAKAMPDDCAFSDSAKMGIGYVMEEKEDLSSAEKYFKEVSDHRLGYQAIALIDLARVSTMLGKTQEALDAYNEYIADQPESRDLDFVRYKLMTLSAAQAKKIKEVEEKLKKK